MQYGFYNTDVGHRTGCLHGYHCKKCHYNIDPPVNVKIQMANTRPMTDIAILSDEVTLLASSSDRVVSLYDLREATRSGPPPVLPHPSFPSTLCAHPTSPHKAASGTYDGFVRMWDLRSVKSPVNAFQVAAKKGKDGGK